MTLLDFIFFILDVACVLLWLSWRAARVDPLRGATAATLMGTLRRAEPGRLRRWSFPVALLALVILRAAFFERVGPAVHWTPRLDLGVVVLAFHADSFTAELLFSVLSCLRALIVFHFWLLFLTVLNRPEAATDPIQRLIAFQLGRAARWPRPVQFILPLLVVAALWMALHPLLTHVGVTNPAPSIPRLAGQGLVAGAALYASLKHILPAFLLVHLVASYIYLGSNPAWDFINTTARNLLAPLQRLPLRMGRVDFTPLVGIVVLLLVLHLLPGLLLELLERYAPGILPR